MNILRLSSWGIFVAAQLVHDVVGYLRRVSQDLGASFSHNHGVGQPYSPLPTGSRRHLRWKDALLRNEIRVLKELGFSLYDIMEHPHKYVLYYVRSLGAGKELAQRPEKTSKGTLHVTPCA